MVVCCCLQQGRLCLSWFLLLSCCGFGLCALLAFQSCLFMSNFMVACGGILITGWGSGQLPAAVARFTKVPPIQCQAGCTTLHTGWTGELCQRSTSTQERRKNSCWWDNVCFLLFVFERVSVCWDWRADNRVHCQNQTESYSCQFYSMTLSICQPWWRRWL